LGTQVPQEGCQDRESTFGHPAYFGARFFRGRFRTSRA
jgi:hypothetical protein